MDLKKYKYNQLAGWIVLLSILSYSFYKMRAPVRQKHSPQEVGGDFSLPSTKGTFNLKNERGKVVVLYFGYTFCPDYCPTTLSNFARVNSMFTVEEKEKVQFIFISVDTERDKLEKLAKYVKFFDNDFIGATSTPEHIAEVTKMYGVKYQKFYPKGKENFYSVDHSTQSFIVGKDGLFKEIILHDEDVNKTHKKLLNYIKEKS